jgi:hypothetical protein
MAALNLVLIVAGGALSAALGSWLSPRIEAEARRHPARGRAAAAGACLSLVGISALVMTASYLYLGLVLEIIGLSNVALMTAALALTTGILGPRLFAAARQGGGEAVGATPPLYPALTAGGVTGISWLAYVVPWAALTMVFPWASPRMWAASLIAVLPGIWTTARLAGALGVLSAVPATWVGARMGRRQFPQVSARVLVAGALLPVSLASAWLISFAFRIAWSTVGGCLVASGLALLLHLAAAAHAVGGASSPDRRRLVTREAVAQGSSAVSGS